MTKLKNTLISAMFALLASMATTPLSADADAFAGPYVGVQFSAVGGELDGQYTDSSGTITKGTGGFATPVGGLELGYALPMGDNALIALGATYIWEDATISKGDDAADAADVTLKAEDFVTIYLQPTVTVSDTSAVYAKVGYSHAELAASGNFTGGSSDEMDGMTVALGSITSFQSGMFMKTEAGITEYSRISVKDIGNAGNNSAKGDVRADPTVAYGAITIGVRF